jgi:hypothetical protein
VEQAKFMTFFLEGGKEPSLSSLSDILL